MNILYLSSKSHEQQGNSHNLLPPSDNMSNLKMLNVDTCKLKLFMNMTWINILKC